jgi:hypothetical protein
MQSVGPHNSAQVASSEDPKLGHTGMSYTVQRTRGPGLLMCKGRRGRGPGSGKQGENLHIIHLFASFRPRGNAVVITHIEGVITTLNQVITCQPPPQMPSWTLWVSPVSSKAKPPGLSLQQERDESVPTEALGINNALPLNSDTLTLKSTIPTYELSCDGCWNQVSHCYHGRSQEAKR